MRAGKRCDVKSQSTFIDYYLLWIYYDVYWKNIIRFTSLSSLDLYFLLLVLFSLERNKAIINVV